MDTKKSSFSTMSKDTNTMRLPRFWDARSGILSPSCSRHAFDFVNYCRKCFAVRRGIYQHLSGPEHLGHSKRCLALGPRCDNRPQHEGDAMIPIRDLFEGHLTVSDLQRSMAFFGNVLGLEIAQVFLERKVAFYWIGGRGGSMLGLWEVGTGPQQLSLHIAFRVDLPDLLRAPQSLRAANVTPLDFAGSPATEPV